MAMMVSMASAQVVQNVIDKQLSLDVSIQRLNDYSGSLPELKEITFGCCRLYGSLDRFLNDFLQKPIKNKDRIVHFLLISAIYQIQHMQRPSHAVVNECVGSLKKTRQSWAANLVNGVLRNILRSNKSSFSQLPLNGKQEHVDYSFPLSLFNEIKTDWPGQYKQILTASNERPPLTLRVNQSRIERKDYEGMLVQADMQYAVTPDSDLGITLEKPVNVQDIPGFTEGLVSVQDESAQLISTAMSLQAKHRVLDGCAAPGGKTCLILEQQNNDGYVVAVDLIDRVPAIQQNLQRLGLSATVIAADLLDRDTWWDGELFDRILLDVPCSGSGVIRRHTDIKHRRSAEDIQRFADQQLAMLRVVWPTLKSGGQLLYVTCSILRKENDGVMEKFSKGTEGIELECPNGINGEKTDFGVQRLPGIQSGDGFYYCSMKKLPE